MKTSDVHCIRCGTQFEPAIPSVEGPPLNGIVFTSQGNYGSAEFDPGAVLHLHEETLLIVLCDQCAITARESHDIIHFITLPAPTPVYRSWQQARAEAGAVDRILSMLDDTRPEGDSSQ